MDLEVFVPRTTTFTQIPMTLARGLAPLQYILAESEAIVLALRHTAPLFLFVVPHFLGHEEASCGFHKTIEHIW